ncbi:MAG TPA: hypothetical protein VFZ99_05010 [Terriglobales bacterium]
MLGLIGVRPVRQYLEIALVIFSGLHIIAALFQCPGQMEGSERVIGLIAQGFVVAFDGRLVVFPLEIKIAYLQRFRCLMRIVGMELLHIVGDFAVRMVLGIVPGRG